MTGKFNPNEFIKLAFNAYCRANNIKKHKIDINEKMFVILGVKMMMTTTSKTELMKKLKEMRKNERNLELEEK